MKKKKVKRAILFDISLFLSAVTTSALATSLTPVKLRIVWSESINGASVPTATPSNLGGTSRVLGALYYVPQPTAGNTPQNPSGTTTLYRLASRNQSGAHYLISTSPREGQYSRDAVLGDAWTHPAYPGVVPITRKTQQRQAAAQPATASYAYSTHPDRPVSLAWVSGGGIRVASNAAAGGAVWEWWWRGRQFINDYDDGRQLSMAVYSDGRTLEETGDHFGNYAGAIQLRHPCPTLMVQTAGDRQATRAIPLDWQPEKFGGGMDNPVIYPNVQIGKNLTLNWTGPDGVNRNWPVAMYESVYHGPALKLASIESPTGYLVAGFNTYYKYDPKTDTLTPFTAVRRKVNISAGGAYGLILAEGKGPNAAAMGVYYNDPRAGLVLYDNSGTSGGQYGSSFSKWGVIFRASVPPTWKFRTWIANGTVADVRSDLHQLHLWGVTSR